MTYNLACHIDSHISRHHSQTPPIDSHFYFVFFCLCLAVSLSLSRSLMHQLCYYSDSLFLLSVSPIVPTFYFNQ
eukprot:m.22643 g.22643  ORF g.22643 m.22643 type:complete len:74 (-) comp13875_c0_seq1:100-321(-)